VTNNTLKLIIVAGAAGWLGLGVGWLSLSHRAFSTVMLAAYVVVLAVDFAVLLWIGRDLISVFGTESHQAKATTTKNEAP